MKRAFGLVLVIAFSLLTSNASAGRGGIDVEHFHPNVDGRGLFTAESAEPLGQWEWGIGSVLHYARNPLVLADDGRSKRGDLVSDRLTASILLSLGLTSWLEVGAALPIALANGAGAGQRGTVQVSGLGSMQLQLKLQLLREARHGIGLALLPAVRLPTGNANAFLGQDGATFSPALLLERGFGALRLLLNVGLTVREPARFLGLTVDDELWFRVGVGVRATESLEVGAELVGATPAASPFGANEGANPLEVLLGVRALLGDTLQLVLGGGFGVTRGYGAPGLRLFAGVVFAPHETDSDGDGVPDRRDRCPLEPGPASNQGCPCALEGKKDSDGDGVDDKDDRCPGVAGPPENHGCPWPDADGDGVIDKEDRCPAQKGPRENQGCPWPDRDGDGVLDKDDKCPDVPGPRENGGCPWPDRDGDGVPDKDDRCPDVPGPKKNRGCPWPDTDGDGVTDNEDDCPTEPGPRSNRGCPIRKKR